MSTPFLACARRVSAAGAMLTASLVPPTAAASPPQQLDDPQPAQISAVEEGGEQVGYRGTDIDGALFIPRLDRTPQLEDFLGMRPPLQLRQQLALATGFTQRNPSDGAPASRRTDVYLGYDDTALHVIFVAFDDQPDAVRARMSRREDIGADDRVTLTIDTDGDQQRGYEFSANPFGIQRDALWTEGDGADTSFDTLWHSEGTPTDQGYVVLMSVPFKSLRFPRRDIQTWGIVLWRWTPRGTAEEATWPPVSSRVEGVLNQAGLATGLTDISPGRNIRLIPYGTFRSFRALDDTPIGPGFVRDLADPNAGLDAKFVVKDALVVDATLNPDFSQVESDQPQNTANRRFETFFPEKRPFFLENSNYFSTPINLLFTRRIVDPQVGVRTTGKLGGWAVGALAIDDRAPGRLADPDSPLAGKRARYGVLRVSRDLGRQSNVGAMFIERSFDAGHNRVGGIDTRVKLNSNWVLTAQAVASETLHLDGTRQRGPAYFASINRTGRKLDYDLIYEDIDEGFRAATGFVPRVGIRRLRQIVNYTFWPEKAALISHGPGFWYEEVLDRDNERLDRSVNPWYRFNLAGQTNVGVFYWGQDLRLRPLDYPVLTADRSYDTGVYGFWFNTAFLKSVEINAFRNSGTSVNFVPAAGRAPEKADSYEGNITVAFRPNARLRLSGRWLYQSLTDPASRERIFRSDIFRSRIDWQFNRELSLRLIVQYESLAADPARTSLPNRRNVNADVLLTYLVNPWTSLYAGYNSNHQNLELLTGETRNLLRRTDGGLLNDANQFFVKVSYLFSY